MSVGTDAGLLAPTWAGTPAAAEVTDEAWLQAMLDAEVALARAQHAVGLTPAAVVETIASAARVERLDLPALARAARAAANPVVALVTAFTEVVAAQDPGAAEYVHRGSTSQDILDSAAMVVARRVLGLIGGDLSRVAAAFAALADTHRHTVLAGRTLAQHAVPTTFGLKAAGWLELVVDATVRVRAVASGLPAQLGGAGGTLAAYREYAAVDRAVRRETDGRGGTARADRTPDAGGLELLGPFSSALASPNPPSPGTPSAPPSPNSGPCCSSSPERSGSSRWTCRRCPVPRSVSCPSRRRPGAGPPRPCRRSGIPRWPR